MLKRKLQPSTERPDFSIRSCTKDLRLRRVFSLGSDSREIESTKDGGPYIGSCEAGCGKDPITDGEIKDASRDCAKENNSDLWKDKGSNCSGGTNKTGYPPKGILKKPNGSGLDREDSIQRTPPENVITRLTPCLRQKLVQVPGSFSYKRLLPFLIEMEKDEVQVSSNEEKPFTPKVDSPNPMLSEDLDFAENPVSSEIFVSTNAQSSEISNPENTQSNTIDRTVDPQPQMDDSIQGTLTFDELSSGNVHKRGKIVTSPEMGEIKRESTGGCCKGICMCLDCVLFRIHAQRSFEFSKKQLTEADEIIGGLVTEISSLRCLLEKFIGKKSEDSSQVYHNELIKAACERASLAERLATMRAKQMFMDLSSHCKLQEERVKFSDWIEQGIISSSLENNARENS